MSNISLEELMDDLAKDLEPVDVLRHPLNRALNYMSIALIYVGGIALFLGFRPDMEAVLQEQNFLFEMILMSALFVSAAFAAAWLCVPDVRGQKWIIAIPLTLFFVFVTWTGLQYYLNEVTIPHIHWHHCAMDAGMVATIPVAAIVFMSMRGATTHPVLSSFMGILSMSALGYISLRFTCMSDELGHIAVYHILPFVVGGSILGYIAQRLYRW